MEHLKTNYITTDLQFAENQRREREGMAEKAIEVIGDLLNNADGFIQELESNDMLGSAIVRRCQELADIIGHLAGEMEDQSDGEKGAMAQACLEDAKNDHDQLATLSEHDMMNALSAAQALMRDIEGSLRSIDRSEADEIADVALTMARLFIMSLQNIHSTMTHDQLLLPQAPSASRDADFSHRIEILDEDDVGGREEEVNAEINSASRRKRTRLDRVRPLWPPLGPAVVSTAHWGKEEAIKKPLLAIALGLTLWPAAIVTAMIGTPILLADGLVQHVYNTMSDGPLVEAIERAAAQLFAAGKLSFLCSRLAVRQTLRVASRQVERHGGVEKLAHEVGGLALERVTHPIETACMAWDGLCMGAGAIKDGIYFVREVAERRGEEFEADIIRQ